MTEVWRRGSVISSWLLDLTAEAFHADPELSAYSGVVSDSGEGAQKCAQIFGQTCAKMGNGVWTVEIIPAEIEPPHHTVTSTSGNIIRFGKDKITIDEVTVETAGDDCAGAATLADGSVYGDTTLFADDVDGAPNLGEAHSKHPHEETGSSRPGDEDAGRRLVEADEPLVLQVSRSDDPPAPEPVARANLHRQTQCRDRFGYLRNAARHENVRHCRPSSA